MNKTALITGANQGIGFATAELLLKQGVAVVLTARNSEKGQQACENLAQYGDCHFLQLDVSDSQSVAQAQQTITEKFGKLDILINNAGINYDTWQNSLTADISEVEQTINTNCLGAWRTIQAFAPLMKKNGGGNIINVSSGAGSLASQTGGTPAYNLSKLAMNGLTLQFANLLKKDNIVVNSVCPGWVRTQMGGMSATRSPQKGAETIVWLALSDDKSQTGKFWRDKKVIDF